MSNKKKNREDFEWRYQPIVGSQGYEVVRFLKQIKPTERSQKYLQSTLKAFWLPYALKKAQIAEEEIKESAWESVYKLYHHIQNICEEFKLPIRIILSNQSVEPIRSNSEVLDKMKLNNQVHSPSIVSSIPDDAEDFLQNFL